MRKRFAALLGALLLALVIPLTAQAKVTYDKSIYPPVSSAERRMTVQVESVKGDVIVSKMVGSTDKASNYKAVKEGGPLDYKGGRYEGSFDIDLATDASDGSTEPAQARIDFWLAGGVMGGRTYTIYCEKKGSIAGDGADVHESVITKTSDKNGVIDGVSSGHMFITVEASGSYRFSINREPVSSTPDPTPKPDPAPTPKPDPTPVPDPRTSDEFVWFGKSNRTVGSGLEAYWVTDRRASNYTPAEGDVVVKSFLLRGSLKNFVLAYTNIDSKYARKHAVLYIQHASGSTETKDAIINSYGTVSYSMDDVTDDTVCTLVVKTSSSVTPDNNTPRDNTPRDNNSNRATPDYSRYRKSLSDRTTFADGVARWIYIVPTEQTTGTLDDMYWSDTRASNYTPLPGDVWASFVLKGTYRNFEIRVMFERQFAGKEVLLYVEHDDGSTEVKERTLDANGEAVFEMERLSTYTLVMRDGVTPSVVRQSVGRVDTSTRSPQTGVGMPLSSTIVPAVVSVLSVIAVAGTVGVRRKLRAQ